MSWQELSKNLASNWEVKAWKCAGVGTTQGLDVVFWISWEGTGLDFWHTGSTCLAPSAV